MTIAGQAAAAQFALSPGQSLFASGAGPFYWSFAASSATSEVYDWVGYKLSTETTWHRCVGPSKTMQLANLPDGAYSITIANDVDLEELAARGMFQSSLNTCALTEMAPLDPISSNTIVIDSQPPNVGTPSVVTSDKTVQVSVQATDGGTGVASYTWIFGDGAQTTTTNPYERYTYLAPGTYSGRVIARDRAGNEAVSTFTVVLTAANSGATTGGGTPTGPTTPPPQGTRHVTPTMSAVISRVLRHGRRQSLIDFSVHITRGAGTASATALSGRRRVHLQAKYGHICVALMRAHRTKCARYIRDRTMFLFNGELSPGRWTLIISYKPAHGYKAPAPTQLKATIPRL